MFRFFERGKKEYSKTHRPTQEDAAIQSGLEEQGFRGAAPDEPENTVMSFRKQLYLSGGQNQAPGWLERSASLAETMDATNLHILYTTVPGLKDDLEEIIDPLASSARRFALVGQFNNKYQPKVPGICTEYIPFFLGGCSITLKIYPKGGLTISISRER